MEELLEQLAGQAPLVLALDDLHWADQSSLALVRRLLGLPRRSPVALVMVSRPERQGDFSAFLHDVSSDALTVSVDLVPLAENDGRELVERLVGAGTLPENLARRLVERASGNPLFLEELVRAMRDAGALRREGDSWQFDEQAPVDLPETVEKLVLSRADRLGPAARRILAAASVLGRQTPLDVLGDVVGDIDQPSLSELERSEMLERTGLGEVRFHHPLVQEAIYNSLLRARRQDLHRAAATALRSRAGHDHAVLAGHLRDAGEDRAAVGEFALAGAEAEGGGAVTEAITSYHAALDAATRSGIPSSDPEIVDLHRRAAWATAGVGDYTRGLELLERSLSGARAAANRRAELEALVDAGYLERSRDHRAGASRLEEAAHVAAELNDPVMEARVWSRLSLLRANRLDLSGAARASEEAQAAAGRACGDEAATIAALDCRKLVALYLGDIRELTVSTDRLLELHGEAGAFQRPFVELERAFIPIANGQWSEARARARGAVKLQQASGLRSFEPIFLDVLCWIARGAGDLAEAETVGRAAHELSVQGGVAEFIATTAATLGWALVEAGRASEALDPLRVGARAAREVAASLQELRCCSMLALALRDAGDQRRAREALGRALSLLAGASVPPGRVLLFAAPAILAAARVRGQLGDRGSGGDGSSRGTGRSRRRVGRIRRLGSCRDRDLARAAACAGFHRLTPRSGFHRLSISGSESKYLLTVDEFSYGRRLATHRRTGGSSMQRVVIVLTATAMAVGGPAAAFAGSHRNHRRTAHAFTLTIRSTGIDPQGAPPLNGHQLSAGPVDGQLGSRPFHGAERGINITAVPNIQSTNTLYDAAGSANTQFSGKGSFAANGDTVFSGSGRITGGTGAYQGATGNLTITGRVPKGSSVAIIVSKGTATY